MILVGHVLCYVNRVHWNIWHSPAVYNSMQPFRQGWDTSRAHTARPVGFFG